MKRIIKCGTAFLLALVLCLCLLPTTAFAASKQVYIWNFPLSDDTLKSSGNWGHGVLNLRFGYRVGASSYTQFRCLDSWQGEVAYCIEPGAPQKNYDSITDHDDTWWDHLSLPDGHPLTPREVQRQIGRIMSYGYHGTIGGGWWADVESTAEKMAWAYATQVLIWEVVAGERDSSFHHIDVKSMGYDEALERVDATHPLRSKILSYYDSIVDSVQTHSRRPSFCASTATNAETLELTWDGSKFTGSITDTNGMLGKYSFSCEDANLTFSKSGDVLTISAEKPISDAVTITAAKEGTTSAGMEGKKNLCAPIPLSLHQRLRTEQEQRGQTLSDYITDILREHFEGGARTMNANNRTIAFQVPEELFGRLKDYLARNGLKQKDFILGLIERELNDAEKEE